MATETLAIEGLEDRLALSTVSPLALEIPVSDVVEVRVVEDGAQNESVIRVENHDEQSRHDSSDSHGNGNAYGHLTALMRQVERENKADDKADKGKDLDKGNGKGALSKVKFEESVTGNDNSRSNRVIVATTGNSAAIERAMSTRAEPASFTGTDWFITDFGTPGKAALTAFADQAAQTPDSEAGAVLKPTSSDTMATALMATASDAAVTPVVSVELLWKDLEFPTYQERGPAPLDHRTESVPQEPLANASLAAAGLDAALQAFLNDVDNLLNDVGAALTGSHTWAWLLAIGVGAGIAAWARKNSRRHAPPLTVALSWVPGLPPLSSERA